MSYNKGDHSMPTPEQKARVLYGIGYTRMSNEDQAEPDRKD